MTPLRWTRTPPTEAGWYWTRMTCHPQCGKPACVRVGENADWQADYVLGGCFDSDCEWSDAPIAPPEEPRSGDPEAAEEEGS